MFERGFKTLCEKTSVSLRKELGLQSLAPLPPLVIATHLGVSVWTPDELDLESASLEILLGDEQGNWSAVTLPHAGRTCIVYNSAHTGGRPSSDIMHELSHLILEHAPAVVFLSPVDGLALRSFDQQQEDEAGWMAGCLLLPRPVLLHIAKSGMTDVAACEAYDVSQHLLTYRRDVTGVSYQMKRRGALRP